ncbi:MAG: hypothetical protein J7L96_01125 [Bacteroidales bacterium]|nr:hypothetical protein [Bacteroidales bacterium]
MKKQNDKQLAWSRQKIEVSMRSIRVKFLLILLAVITLPAVVFALSDPTDQNIEVAAEVGGSGLTMASMALVGNLMD